MDLRWWIFALFMVSLVLYLFIPTMYWMWKVRKLERYTPLPIEVWQSFAAELPEPDRTQMFALIHQGRYPLGAVMRMAFWLQAKQKQRAVMVPRRSNKYRFSGVKDKPGVYVLENQGYYKIGCSSSMRNRIHSIQTTNPTPVSVVCLFYTEDYQQLETELHLRYGARRINREWFALLERDVQRLIVEARNLNTAKSSAVPSGSDTAAEK